ncbi:MAG: hypothetical protein ACI9SY_000705 [Candidatus Paceibacteria bacterium]|jgi:hypothetical protein
MSIYGSYAALLARMYRFDKTAIDQIAGMLELEHVMAIDEAIEALRQRSPAAGERWVTTIKRFYGLGCEKVSLAVIGQEYDQPVTASRVNQIRSKAELVMRKSTQLQPVIVMLTAAGLEGRWTQQVLVMPSPKDLASLEVLTMNVQPTGLFLQDHFHGCTQDQPCPTCQAEQLLMSAGIYDAFNQLQQDWSDGEETSWRSVNVAVFDFSQRTSNCLRNDGIKTLGQLVQKTEFDLLRIDNFGRKGMNEIKANLAELSLSLSDS